MTIDEAEKIRKVVENKDYIAQLVNAFAKKLIEEFENLKIEYVDMFQLGYNKAIDDFVKALEDHQQKNWIDNLEYGITFADIEQVAAQLKERKNDGE